MRKALLITLLCILHLSLAAFPLKVKGVDTTSTAIYILDLRWGTELVKANIDTPLVPASVTKSVTVATMLELADGSERFETPVVAEGEILPGGVLNGSLRVLTCGDPTIESRFLPEAGGFVNGIVEGVRRLGIQEIKGTVIIDQQGFPDATTPPGWMSEDLLWPYGARLFGANFRDNRFLLSLPSKKTVPEVPGLSFTFTNPGGRGVKVDRKDGSETFIVSGNSKRGFSDTFAMPDPSKAMKAAIVSALETSGVKIDNAATPRPTVTNLVYTHLSPTFETIMRSLMHRSDNLMAEGMLRAISPGGTRAQALEEERAVWNMAGIISPGVKIVDGSGLSRHNRLTARFLAEVNRHLSYDEFDTDFTSLFPRAGRDGTLKNFLKDTPLEGRVAMKTGSMRGVQSYSGYMLDETGHPTHIIVMIANGFTCSRPALKEDFKRLLLETLDK